MRRAKHFRPATLGDMATQGIDIWCWCNGCCHHAVLETAALIGRLGRDQGAPGIADHAYCGRCGSRAVETRPHWPTVGVVAQHSPLNQTGTGKRHEHNNEG